MNKPNALIAGANGFVGGHCLHYALNSGHYEHVYALVREPLDLEHPRLTVLAREFDTANLLEGVDRVRDVFCCLGTPLNHLHRHAELLLVDYAYPKKIADLALQHGAEKYMVITSSGIGHHSPIYYCRVKTRLEDELSVLPYRTVLAFRPSLLLGKRPRPARLQRLIGQMIRPFSPLFRGPLGPYRPVEGEALGYAMVAMAQDAADGFQRVPSHHIHQLFSRRATAN